jgi:hypothetical protein
MVIGLNFQNTKKLNTKLGSIHDIVDKQNFNEDSDLHEISTLNSLFVSCCYRLYLKVLREGII